MILNRIVEGRLELVAAVNAGMVAITSFGVSLSDVQQMAVAGVVNAVLIFGYRLVKGTPVVVDAQRKVG